jgi:hypothetical protein
VIDLEGLAVIEVLLLGIDLPPQPTKNFENNLFSIVQI